MTIEMYGYPRQPVPMEQVGIVNPASLFPAQGYILNPSDISTMWQDSAGTTPVTAAGNPVGRIIDVSGNGYIFTQATAANRPTYQISATTGAGCLRFDGVNDYLSSTATVNLSSGTKLFTAIGMSRNSGGSQRIPIFGGYGAVSGGFTVYAPVGNDDSVGVAVRGTANGYQTQLFGPGVVLATHTGTWDMTVATIAGAITSRINGRNYNYTAGGSNPGTAAGGSNLTNFIGASSVPSAYFSGDIYGVVVRCASVQVTGTERTGVENYLNTKAGAW